MNRTDEQILNDRFLLYSKCIKEIYFMEISDKNYQDTFIYPCSIKFYQTPYKNYAISKCGKIWNILTNKLVTTSISANNYLRVSLLINDQRKNIFVHRLIAKTFLDNSENYMIVHHLDNNQLHNHVDNLAWVTIEENNASHRRKSHNKIYSKNDIFIRTKRKGQDNINKLIWTAKKIDNQIAHNNIDRSKNTFHVAAATKILLDIYNENNELLYQNISAEECLNILKLPVRYLEYIRSDYMTLEYMFLYKDEKKKIHAIWNDREVFVFF